MSGRSESIVVRPRPGGGVAAAVQPDQLLNQLTPAGASVRLEPGTHGLRRLTADFGDTTLAEVTAQRGRVGGAATRGRGGRRRGPIRSRGRRRAARPQPVPELVWKGRGCADGAPPTPDEFDRVRSHHVPCPVVSCSVCRESHHLCCAGVAPDRLVEAALELIVEGTPLPPQPAGGGRRSLAVSVAADGLLRDLPGGRTRCRRRPWPRRRRARRAVRLQRGPLASGRAGLFGRNSLNPSSEGPVLKRAAGSTSRSPRWSRNP
jgi:hypothetical protein